MTDVQYDSDGQVISAKNLLYELVFGRNQNILTV